MSSVFKSGSSDSDYCDFAITDKREIKDLVENSVEVNNVIAEMQSRLMQWWNVASKEFATLACNQDALLPKVRSSLMLTMKKDLEPVGMLDQHQVAGIFVNWWDGVKYDLKTIMQRGWDIDLIYPESSDLIVSEFFQKESNEIKSGKDTINSIETLIDELVEKALETVEYESEESEDDEEAKEVKRTSKLALEQLNIALDECADEDSDDKTAILLLISELKDAEELLKKSKAILAQQEEQLLLKVEFKCLGCEEKKNYLKTLIEQTESELSIVLGKAIDLLDDPECIFSGEIDCTSLVTINASLDIIKSSIPSSKKKRTPEDEVKLARIKSIKTSLRPILREYNKLSKKIETMYGYIKDYDNMMKSLGGQITLAETQNIILKKHYNIIVQQLDRYIAASKRNIINAIEHLYDKYSMSAKMLSDKRDQAMDELNIILKNLHYFE